MRRLWVVTLCALMAGCASPPPARVAADSVLFRPVAAHFEVTGRLSARHGDVALSGRFDWQHAPTRDRWDFYSPLGQVLARLNNEAGTATLTLADGAQYVEPMDALLTRLLGMEVPVAALPRWLQGGVVALEDVREVDGAGRPLRVVDQGWQIRYPGYAGEATDARPRVVEISRGDALLKLIVDAWQ
ncbi:MAG: outer membrane lipoprotein LolB [Rhodocyclaceae bacterium]|nr:outer membrane lipoprotein LolB [Rhodocyclaceae bacterium]